MVLGLNVFFSHKTFVHNKSKITINTICLCGTFYRIVVQDFNNVFTAFSKLQLLMQLLMHKLQSTQLTIIIAIVFQI